MGAARGLPTGTQHFNLHGLAGLHELSCRRGPRANLNRSCEKARRGFPERKSGLPDLRTHEKPISGGPEIGARLVSWKSVPPGEAELVPLCYC
jgi:hypothetical protein